MIESPRYGEHVSTGGRVSRVRFASPAWRAGLRAGDVILRVDGRPVADVLDWRWATADTTFRVDLMRQSRELSFVIERGASDTGVEFESVLFDEVRECVNACSFCFIRQLPGGLREALYLRDDDYRLSFLHGNFITLTNLTEHDLDRIVEQRLSPLYVSLHAVDPEIRRVLVACSVEDTAVDRFVRLVGSGIDIHVQIVAVPGVNDGAVLDQTLDFLRPYAHVRSVGIVPLGHTRHQRRFVASYSADQARELLSQIGAVQERMRAERGSGWVYAADEFYLLAGEEPPEAESYDGFPQYENGIGLVRVFADEFSRLATEPASRSRRVTAVTGTMFAPVLRRLLDRAHFSGAVRVLAVENRLLGGNVGVAGLLAGQDIADAVARDGATGTYLVPDVVLNSDGLTLDDRRLRDIARISGVKIRLVEATGAGLASALARL